ncbi:MAG: Nif3-like dinuclear metal center hexameric protein, partial [Chitinophagales bacterium]|nr:Nif3-like dinuclear metal center hexameric protein [Chitinophagales bacterium]
MKISEVIQYLETIAPPGLQENYDNAGLLVGDKNEEVTGIMISLDATEEIVQQASDNHCNLIISHHPIIFSGLKKMTGTNYIERTVISAIKKNIALYAIHTNLDSIQGGVNQKFADKLNLVDCEILQPRKGVLKKLVTFVPSASADMLRQVLFDAGAGNIGAYDHCSYNVSGTGTFRGNETTNPYVGVRGKDHQEPETRIETIFPFWLEDQLISALTKNHPYEEAAFDIYPLDNVYQNAGAGLIGKTATSYSEEEFLRFVKDTMGSGSVRYTALRNKPVERVAVCGGSGSFLLKEAIHKGADVFITADFKYHQ